MWPDLTLAALVLALWTAQLLMTLAYREHLYLEDAGESLRSPYWWRQGMVINGIASNVGYYATIAWAYSLFGYSVYMAKWVRLGLHLLSLIATAALLRRWIGSKRALLPLLAAGLSPSWLYFNVNQASFGIDLQYLPLLILLAVTVAGLKGRTQLAATFFLGAAWMWAALSYPPPLFAIPPTAILFLWILYSREGHLRIRRLLELSASAVAGAVIPPAAFLAAAKTPSLLIYDPYVKAGMLRGGGGGFTRRIGVIAEHHAIVWRDLFLGSNSYSFALPHVEFGNWPARLAVALLALKTGRAVWRRRTVLRNWRQTWATRDAALLAWLVGSLIFLFCFPQLVATFPGLRRTASVLIPFYGLVAFLWSKDNETGSRWLVATACALLIAGHLWSFQKNLHAGQERAPGINWFLERPTAKESLEHWEKVTREGGMLRCETFDSTTCRYQEIYTAIQGYRLWNGLPPHEVLGWDPMLKKVRPIELSIWESNEWPRW